MYAKAASAAAELICVHAISMSEYYYASKMIKPLLEALSTAQANLAVALKKPKAAKTRLAECNATLASLQAQFEQQMAAKQQIAAIELQVGEEQLSG